MSTESWKWVTKLPLSGVAGACLGLAIVLGAVGLAYARMVKARAVLIAAKAAALKDDASARDIRVMTDLKVRHFDELAAGLRTDLANPMLHEQLARLTSGATPQGASPDAAGVWVLGLTVMPSLALTASPSLDVSPLRDQVPRLVPTLRWTADGGPVSSG